MNPTSPYWLSAEGQARLAEMARERAPELPPEPVPATPIELHNAALARRDAITRTYGRDPGPQPGELTDAEFHDQMAAVDDAIRASFGSGRAVDHRWDAPENDFAKEWLTSLGGES